MAYISSHNFNMLVLPEPA